jgi:hypothetical protein
MMTNNPLTCAEFEALVPDLLEDSLSPRERERMDAHRLDCAECDALVADLLDIRRKAASLPMLTPSRDLWSGVEARIQAEIVEFPRTPMPGEVAAVVPTPVHSVAVSREPSAVSRRPQYFRIAIAASLLVAATAGITWSIASRSAPAPLTADAPTAGSSELIRPVNESSMEASYDREISDLRRIVEEHRPEMDSVTAAVLERNLKVIDDAIAESKAALASSPESAFLLERLNDAYASKLRTLRAVAVTPRRG